MALPMVPMVGLQCLIVVFPDHTPSLFLSYSKFPVFNLYRVYIIVESIFRLFKVEKAVVSKHLASRTSLHSMT